jgi:hypothetical protein
MPINNSNMITFEEKVVSFQRKNEEFQQLIVRGSDEHLDFLLSIKEKLNGLNESFSELLNKEIIPSSNKFTFEEVEKTIPTLLDLYSSLIKLVAALKRSSVGKDLTSTSQLYYTNVEDFRELIYDLENFRKEDSSLDLILQDINNL